MITLSRSLARHLRAVFRRLAVGRSGSVASVSVELHATRDGLRALYRQTEAAAEFHQAGTFGSDIIRLPLEALADCEGRDDGPVTVQRLDEGRVELRWESRNLPCLRDYVEPAEDVAAFPEPPSTLVPNGPELLAALDAAVQSTARDSVRYALTRVQLRGGTGEVVATDGKQLLIQGGFRFPWTDELLVTRTSVFGCKELSQAETVRVGRTESHVCFRVGGWTIWLAIDKDGRFPRAEQVIPTMAGEGTRLRLDTEDAAAMVHALPTLPGADDDCSPVTVDLNGQVTLRARGSGQGRATELVLARSEVTGKPVRFVTDRQYLARAWQLGFREVVLAGADKPAVCQDGRRTYVWMVLGSNGALSPQPDDLRVSTATGSTPKAKAAAPAPKHREKPPAKPSTGSTGVPATSVKSGSPSKSSLGLVEEALEVQRLLREALGRSRLLMAAIQQHRKQSRLLRTTLASLKQLQHVGG